MAKVPMAPERLLVLRYPTLANPRGLEDLAIPVRLALSILQSARFISPEPTSLPSSPIKQGKLWNLVWRDGFPR